MKNKSLFISFFIINVRQLTVIFCSILVKRIIFIENKEEKQWMRMDKQREVVEWLDIVTYLERTTSNTKLNLTNLLIVQ